MTISEIRTRYGILVDKKYTSGLTESELAELQHLIKRLDAEDAKFYNGVKAKLNEIS